MIVVNHNNFNMERHVFALAMSVHIFTSTGLRNFPRTTPLWYYAPRLGARLVTARPSSFNIWRCGSILAWNAATTFPLTRVPFLWWLTLSGAGDEPEPQWKGRRRLIVSAWPSSRTKGLFIVTSRLLMTAADLETLNTGPYSREISSSLS